MTTATRRVAAQSRRVQLERLARDRKAALTKADADRKKARDEAHKAFVIGVKQLIDSGEESVSSAALAVGLSRGVLHDLIRNYS